MAQRFLKSFDRHGQADLVAIRKQSAIVLATLNTFTGTPSTVWVSTLSVSSRSVKRTSRTGAPSILGAQSFWPMAIPHMPWQLIGKFMKRERRNEADNALRQTLSGLREAMVCVERGVGELIKPACKTKHLTIALHTAHGGGSHALSA